MSEGGKKFDQDKIPMELLPPIALEEIAKVLGFGAKKYGEWNWSKGIKHSRIIGAALRHLSAYQKGETLDPESGLPHLAHFGCCALFLIHLTQMRPDLDDRPEEASLTKKQLKEKELTEQYRDYSEQLELFDYAKCKYEMATPYSDNPLLKSIDQLKLKPVDESTRIKNLKNQKVRREFYKK